MNRPMCLRRAGIISARISAKNQQPKKPARSRRFQFEGSTTVYLVTGWTLVNVALGSHMALSAYRGEYVAAGLLFGAFVVSVWAEALLVLGRLADHRRRARVRQAEQKRAELIKSLDGCAKHDPRRGSLRQELNRSTLVVLTGGKA